MIVLIKDGRRGWQGKAGTVLLWLSILAFVISAAGLVAIVILT